ncbi:hypothetical protein PCASD_08140 [Puccinia coronata f. sp. avenae]|uniref:Uncharacterized protein n=1 Tax=Puccinia coronata f. sp. avenae TaxID=200324 RepID=A0A2N5VAG3_9BASI|nr:hypothetical protein PCASD_08140 [Puccinia coronata f. sp. avenae]
MAFKPSKEENQSALNKANVNKLDSRIQPQQSGMLTNNNTVELGLMLINFVV